MSTNTVSNWFGNVISHPAVIVDAYQVEDIVAVMKDPVKYPSPVRAVGSNHSNPPCGVAENGTLIRMKMNQVLSITDDTLTVQAGAILIDLTKQLEARNLQFYVNTEIGSLSAGSAAIAGTKDASFEGEYGQVGSYIIAMKMVLPSGELMEVTEAAQPDLMQVLRSSYGLFGIVYEVTYKVRPAGPDARAPRDLQPGRFSGRAACTQGPRRLDVLLHVPFFRPHHGRVPPLQSQRHRTRPTALRGSCAITSGEHRGPNSATRLRRRSASRTSATASSTPSTIAGA